MAEIDLIPSDYRLKLANLKLFQRHAIVLAVLTSLFLAGYVGLAYARHHLQSDINHLQHDHAITNSQRADLERLEAEKSRLAGQLDLLDGLSGGVSAPRMFQALDRALSDDVWFTHVQFQRKGKLADTSTEPEPTGYFLIIHDTPGQAGPRKLQIDSKMTIHGLARNHAALSTFISRLITQPEVATTHLLNATVRNRIGEDDVEFDLEVGINMKAGG